MPIVVVKKGMVEAGGVGYGKIEQLGQVRVRKRRDPFENLSEEEQFERTYFRQHLDPVEGKIAVWRRRKPRRDNTVLTVIK